MTPTELVALIGGSVGGVTGVIAAIVAIYNAIKSAKKTDVDVLRGIIAELRCSLQTAKEINANLDTRIASLEDQKVKCTEMLAKATKELDRLRRTLAKRGLELLP